MQEGVVQTLPGVAARNSVARYIWPGHVAAQSGGVCPLLCEWVQALNVVTEGQVIAVDGKTLRGSGDAAHNQNPLHVVQAWATANQLMLGQVAVDDKSNEITAIPRLLKLLELKGAIVTIDAMG